MSLESRDQSFREAITQPIPTIDVESQDELLVPDEEPGVSKFAVKFLMGSFATSLALTAFFNGATVVENFEAATDTDDRNNYVSDVASDINNYGLRVDCDDDVLDTADATASDGLTSAAHVRPLKLWSFPVALPVMTVREDICDEIVNADIDALQEPDADRFEREEYAVASFILLHEGEHTKQVFDEAEATCNAIQKLPYALVDSGFDGEIAREMAQSAADIVSTSQPSEYYSEECAPGGDYDLAIGDLYISQSPVAQN